jgi:hypothetical protein
LTDVSFVNSDIIRLTKHISPAANRFEFYRLARHHSFQLESKSSAYAGAVCSIAHGSDKVACIQGSQILINDNVVFVRNALVDANRSESMRLKVGSVEGSNNAPSFKIQVTSLNDGVNLRVGLPTGNWIASRIVDGAALPNTFEDRIYNFIPTIVSRSGGIVNIDVLVSATDFRSFDRAIYLNFPRRPHDDISVVITQKTRVKFAWRHIVPATCAIEKSSYRKQAILSTTRHEVERRIPAEDDCLVRRS